MPQGSGGNLLVVHGGGPTAVMNASLKGVIDEAGRHGRIKKILGARFGVEGILNEAFVDLGSLSVPQRTLLSSTPASAIGTSRKKLYPEDYEKIITILVKNDIEFLLFNGGNGSMDTCGRIYELADARGIKVIGIPKTMDNDIAVTDHSPGFGSAARFMAVSTAEVGVDVRSMPIHVCIIEAMGRNAGWLTASSILARKKEGEGPHLVYVPERPFYKEEFLQDVEVLFNRLGGVIVVVSEGIADEEGKPIAEPVLTRGRDVYFGDVGSCLAAMVIKELGIKARSEKPGLLSRASIALQSQVDRAEAEEVGAFAVRAALQGHTGCMVGIKRVSSNPYRSEPFLIPIQDVMMHERKLPMEYINKRGNGILPAFADYCRPLIGEEIPDYFSLDSFFV